jgi:hypothetical protein
MNVTPYMPQTRTTARPVAADRKVDVSRGASQFDIRAQVFIEKELLDCYGEIDPALGKNVIGIILSVLSCHLGMGHGSLGDDQITVCLTRREDDCMVEVDLGIRRHRHEGRECMSLRKLAERGNSE